MSGDISSAGLVWRYENTGDDAYALSWTDTVRIPNGNDVDQDGKPEFFISFAWYNGSATRFRLMAFEMVSDNLYERHEIASVICNIGTGWNAYSKCGDVDADGIDEVVWTTGSDVFIYKGTGNDQYELVWQWHNPTSSSFKLVKVNIYDLNRNGYNEVILSGIFEETFQRPVDAVQIYELETVELFSPNGGQKLRGGETCEVSWRVYQPPRCDSVSLFLLADTTWVLDTIVTGLAPTESSYSWVVPDTTLNWAKIVAIAYGHAWQFDASESAFAIVSSGITEEKPAVIKDWSLRVSPGFGSVRISYDVPEPSFIRLSLYDATGRLIKELTSGRKETGRYTLSIPEKISVGIYFIRLDTPKISETEKVIILR